MTYKFDKQLSKGKAGEWVMDRYHEPFYHIDKVDPAIEKRDGYDRIYTSRVDGYDRPVKVEIKTDYLSQRYGNIIIETVSMDSHDIPGWALTSRCDVLIFYLWHLNEVLYYRMSDVEEKVPAWKLQYGH